MSRTSGATATAAADLDLWHSDDLRLASAPGAGACYRASGLIRNPPLSGYAHVDVPFHSQPRRVRSGGRSRRRAVRAVFHGLFSLPMKHLGCEPRSIFPSAKVGRTAFCKYRSAIPASCLAATSGTAKIFINLHLSGSIYRPPWALKFFLGLLALPLSAFSQSLQRKN